VDGYCHASPAFSTIGYKHLAQGLFQAERKEEANAFSFSIENYSRSQIHEHTMSMRILDIILRVLRLEVSVWIS
jgi:hypothetical protein